MTRLAGPLIYILALIFALCWLFHICGPLFFLSDIYTRLTGP